MAAGRSAEGSLGIDAHMEEEAANDSTKNRTNTHLVPTTTATATVTVAVPQPASNATTTRSELRMCWRG